MAEYDPWAPYYDLVHPGLPGEAEFYVGQAVRAGADTLELGAGTGRIALPMAMSGIHVTALDVSRAMLQVCREKLEQLGPLPGRVELVEADMRNFDLGRTFPLLVMAYRTFMHLLTVRDQEQSLAAVARHLDEDGRFMLNVWAARPSRIAALQRVQAVWRLAGEWEVDGRGGRLRHFQRARYDEHRQWIREEHRLEEVGARGQVRRRELLPLTRAWQTPREMEHLLARCGFQMEACFGDFECARFQANSTEMVWVLRKA